MGYTVRFNRLSLWHLGSELELSAQDLSLSTVAIIRNDAAIRGLCAARQICLRFGRRW